MTEHIPEDSPAQSHEEFEYIKGVPVALLATKEDHLHNHLSPYCDCGVECMIVNGVPILKHGLIITTYEVEEKEELKNNLEREYQRIIKEVTDLGDAIHI